MTDYNQYTVELKGYIGVGPTLKSASYKSQGAGFVAQTYVLGVCTKQCQLKVLNKVPDQKYPSNPYLL